MCGHANGESIAIAIAPALLGSLGKRLDFVWGEVLTDAQLGIFRSPDTASSDSPQNDTWTGLTYRQIVGRLPRIGIVDSPQIGPLGTPSTPPLPHG